MTDAEHYALADQAARLERAHDALTPSQADFAKARARIWREFDFLTVKIHAATSH